MNHYSQALYRFLESLAFLVLRFAHPHWKIVGKENIPESPYILVANHSAATDPIYVILAQNPKRLYTVIAKRQVLEMPVVGFLLKHVGVIPVDRDGTDSGVVMAMMKNLKSGKSLLLFPEGTRMHNNERLPAKGGAVLLSSRCQVPLVPVYITRNKRFWHPVTVVFGKPYIPQTSGRHISQEEQDALNLDMMDRCYKLGEPYEN